MKKLFSLSTIILITFVFIYSCSPEEETQAPTTTVQSTTPEPEPPAPTQYTLTVSAGEGGTVSTEGGAYDEGTNVTVTATPAEGYEFVGWEGSDETINSISITLSADTSLTALFQNTIVSEIIGKWDFSSDTGKNSCTVISIIFSSDLNFKLYTQNVVILGNFSVSQGTISLLVSGNSIGTIAGVTVSGTSLSATFNVNGYCVAVQVAQKNTTYTLAKTYIPDDNFEETLIGLGYDDVLDDYVLTNDINSITSLDINTKGISDLTGIEDFTSLVQLLSYQNNLSTINLSVNTSLNYLELGENNITSVDLSTNTLLEHLNLFGNQLTSINVSTNQTLTYLSLGGNSFTNIDVSNNLLLTDLLVFDNDLSSLDISGSTGLINLMAKGNTNLSCVQVNQTQLNQPPLGFEKDGTTIYSLDCTLSCNSINSNNLFNDTYTSLKTRYAGAQAQYEANGIPSTGLDAATATSLGLPGPIPPFDGLFFGNKTIYFNQFFDSANGPGGSHWSLFMEGQYGVYRDAKIITFGFSKQINQGDTYIEFFYDSVTDEFLMVRLGYYQSSNNALNSCTQSYHFVQKRYFSNRTKIPNFTDNCQAEYFDCLQDTFDSAVQYSNSISSSFSIDVTATSNSNYTLSGADRAGIILEDDPDLIFNVGDTINFVISASGHPFYLKTVAGTGTGDTISGITNNGTTNQTITWTPTSAGTFYYQCSLHGGMVGTITIQ